MGANMPSCYSCQDCQNELKTNKTEPSEVQTRKMQHIPKVKDLSLVVENAVEGSSAEYGMN